MNRDRSSEPLPPSYNGPILTRGANGNQADMGREKQEFEKGEAKEAVAQSNAVT